MANYTDYVAAVEVMSGGINKVIFDDSGLPSIMVIFPKLKYNDVIDGGTDDILPAFIINEIEQDILYIGKYQSTVFNNRAYSLPLRNPKASVSFDNARLYCRNKGKGWHLQTNALWAAISLWCTKNTTIPHGNNNYGSDITCSHEKGLPATKESSGDFRTRHTLTGSGQNTWYHNYNSVTGIADMNGNLWEWCGGLRLQNGEIQVIPYGNAANDTEDLQNADSTAWKAILQNGAFTSVGADNTLKLNYADNKISLTTSIYNNIDKTNNAPFESFITDSTITEIPQILKGLDLYPYNSGNHFDDIVYMNNLGEYLPSRGGPYGDGVRAGIFALNLGAPRSKIVSNVGFRSAYYKAM